MSTTGLVDTKPRRLTGSSNRIERVDDQVLGGMIVGVVVGAGAIGVVIAGVDGALAIDR